MVSLIKKAAILIGALIVIGLLPSLLFGVHYDLQIIDNIFRVFFLFGFFVGAQLLYVAASLRIGFSVIPERGRHSFLTKSLGLLAVNYISTFLIIRLFDQPGIHCYQNSLGLLIIVPYFIISWLVSLLVLEFVFRFSMKASLMLGAIIGFFTSLFMLGAQLLFASLADSVIDNLFTSSSVLSIRYTPTLILLSLLGPPIVLFVLFLIERKAYGQNQTEDGQKNSSDTRRFAKLFVAVLCAAYIINLLFFSGMTQCDYSESGTATVNEALCRTIVCQNDAVCTEDHGCIHGGHCVGATSVHYNGSIVIISGHCEQG